jgi:hypothetical protein
VQVQVHGTYKEDAVIPNRALSTPVDRQHWQPRGNGFLIGSLSRELPPAFFSAIRRGDVERVGSVAARVSSASLCLRTSHSLELPGPPVGCGLKRGRCTEGPADQPKSRKFPGPTTPPPADRLPTTIPTTHRRQHQRCQPPLAANRLRHAPPSSLHSSSGLHVPVQSPLAALKTSVSCNVPPATSPDSGPGGGHAPFPLPEGRADQPHPTVLNPGTERTD